MLVFAQVSSMKTIRLGSTQRWTQRQRVRRRMTSGRSCSLAKSVFFKRLAQAAHEPPQRVAADLNPTLFAQLRQKLVQGQVLLLFDPRQQPLALTRQQRPHVTADLARLNRSSRPPCLRPADTSGRANLQQPGRRPRRHASIKRAAKTDPQILR
tara:strand:- start:10840 stop:11301 length:462 start_codon:yes stop_codon:yes gene_type:complete